MNIDTTKDINLINLNSANCVGNVTDAVTVESKDHPHYREVMDGVTIYVVDYDTDETVASLKGGDIVDFGLEGAELAWFKWDCGLKVLAIEAYFRHCSECGAVMYEGFMVDGGLEYYCSKECLHKHYTDEEWDEMYGDGDTDNCWTQWY